MTDTSPAATEVALQRLLTTYIFTGLLFLVLPGTFLGVWNLISISGRHSLAGLSPSWLQAHGHAQIFGWLGTFIIGIGYYSLVKMGRIMPFAVTRGWASWALWTSGVTLRWVANVSEWNWRVLLPVSAALQLTGFLIFFATVSGHRSRPAPGPEVSASPRTQIETWMMLIIASSAGFLLALLMNQVESIHLAMTGTHPEIPHWLDQRYLFLAAWGFPVLAVWGFNARWLPVFLGLRKPSGGGLMAALGRLWLRHRSGPSRPIPAGNSVIADRVHRRLYRPESLPTVAKAGEDSRGLRLFSVFRARRLCLASCRGRPRCLRGAIRYQRRHLGSLAPRSYRRVPRHYGVCDRPESTASVQRNAAALQQEVDVRFSGGPESWLPPSGGL